MHFPAFLADQRRLRRVLSSSRTTLATLTRLHALLVVSSSQHILSSLAAAYARAGALDAAESTLAASPSSPSSIAAWNGLLSAHSRAGAPGAALRVFRALPSSARPNSTTFTLTLTACARLGDLDAAESVRVRAFAAGYGHDVFVCSALLHLYSRCGAMEEAIRVFDGMPRKDRVAWSTMVAGFVTAGRPVEALAMYSRMREHGVSDDEVVMVGVIQACMSTGNARIGASVHGRLLRHCMRMDVVTTTSLVSMYAKNGHLDVACQVFRMMPYRNDVTWSALISGFAQNGRAVEALDLFRELQADGLQPCSWALVSALLACASVGFLKLGKSIHGFILRRLEWQCILGTAVLDMYSKCGSLESARKLFNKLSSRDLVLWNAIIACCGTHGCGHDALALFQELNETGIKPDHATFASLLSALSHSGLVEEGKFWFDRMIKEFGIEPAEKHYVCIVDLLARSGLVEEANDMLASMQTEPTIAIWVTLLSGCLNNKKLELGETIAKKILELRPEDIGVLALVSNLYAAAKKWDKVREIRKLMKDSGSKKVPGYSLIEVKGTRHTFVMEDQSHPQHREILKMVAKLNSEMRKLGYVPRTEFVYHDLDEDVKEQLLSYHRAASQLP
jgi:pentatricopeptide repeat protein